MVAPMAQLARPATQCLPVCCLLASTLGIARSCCASAALHQHCPPPADPGSWLASITRLATWSRLPPRGEGARRPAISLKLMAGVAKLGPLARPSTYGDRGASAGQDFSDRGWHEDTRTGPGDRVGHAARGGRGRGPGGAPGGRQQARAVKHRRPPQRARIAYQRVAEPGWVSVYRCRVSTKPRPRGLLLPFWRPGGWFGRWKVAGRFAVHHMQRPLHVRPSPR